VLEALLWAFHNAKSGVCFPSYEKIAEAAGCARSTVAEAIRALEDAGVLSWVQRIKRVRVRCPDLFGADGVRVVPQRTSNAYHFNDPGGEGAASNFASVFTPAPKSEKPTGTPNQDFFSSMGEQVFQPDGNKKQKIGTGEQARGGGAFYIAVQ
jgi:DNA-binding transcriptional MocR family regulator